jgi:hypothetical protein
MERLAADAGIDLSGASDDVVERLWQAAGGTANKRSP